MTVYFIYHSSFLVETENAYFLFDYVKGKIPELKGDKPLYLLASHRHGDHFSEAIFDLSLWGNRKVKYILSHDIWEKRVPEECRDRTKFLGPDETMDMDGWCIQTLKSTDEGVAFLLSSPKHTIYHGGDLNDWQWDGEPAKVNAAYRTAYRKEIEKLEGRTLDLAFLPLDPRQEEYFADGFDWFMKHVSVRWAYPMHCWEDESVIGKLKALPCAQGYASRIVENSPFKIA